MTYVLKNHQEIAELFDQRAKLAEDMITDPKSRAGLLLKREAITWRAAADFVRVCIIDEGESHGEEKESKESEESNVTGSL